ncbi:MAG: hypothetical protein PWQ57_2403 [Desulfovibrionales bacterium]|nr:hypothetical protein [Desulfovibrionales bacterium]
MDFYDLVCRTRTRRRFVQTSRIPGDVLLELVDTARQTCSVANLQPLKYVLSNEPEMNEKIFSTLGWAAYLKDWPGPEPGERPAGYIVILQDESIAKKVDCDHGVAAWTIMLGAAELGLGGCIFGNIKHQRLAEILELPEGLSILLVAALGEPAETVVLEEVRDGDIRYYRDEQGVHHTPKRSLEEVVRAVYFEDMDEEAPEEAEQGLQPAAQEPAPNSRPSAKPKKDIMPTREKAQLAAYWLDQAKAANVVALDVEGVCPIAEAMVIATASSARHAKGLADRLTELFSEHNLEFLGIEGFRGGEWILLDCNDVVVHIFQDETRRLYDLEGLWSEAKNIDWSRS